MRGLEVVRPASFTNGDCQTSRVGSGWLRRRRMKGRALAESEPAIAELVIRCPDEIEVEVQAAID